MTEYVKVEKTIASASGNQYGVSGSVSVDLTNNVTKVTQTVRNDIRMYPRGTSSSTRAAETRAYNRKMLTDKIEVNGYLTRTTTTDAVTIKNKLLAMLETEGLCTLYWRGETFPGSNDGVTNSNSVSFTDAKFTDNRAKPLREVSGTASSGSTTSLTDSGKSWTANQWVDHWVFVTSGTGTGQGKQITANTTTSLTVATWTAPVNGDTYVITNFRDNEIVYDFTLSFTKSKART